MFTWLIDVLYYTTFSFIGLAILIKFIFWVQQNPARRVPLIRSFFMFFSIHDLHNASTQNSKRFRRVNNITNYIFWTCVVLLIFVYIFNTKEVLDTEPTKIPTKRH